MHIMLHTQSSAACLLHIQGSCWIQNFACTAYILLVLLICSCQQPSRPNSCIQKKFLIMSNTNMMLPNMCCMKCLPIATPGNNLHFWFPFLPLWYAFYPYVAGSWLWPREGHKKSYFDGSGVALPVDSGGKQFILTFGWAWRDGKD